MYHLSEIEHVLSIYDTTHSFKETIRLAGYPSRETLRLWLRQRQQGSLPPASRGSKRATRPRHSNVTPEERIRACVRSFGDRNAIRAVAKELGVDRSSLYTWICELSSQVQHLPRKDLIGSFPAQTLTRTAVQVVKKFV